MKYKPLLIIITVFILLSSCTKNDTGNGKEPKISRIYGGGVLQSEYFYNEAGLLLTYTLYNSAGKKGGETTCSYDIKNRLIKKETAFDYSSGPNPQWGYGYTEYNYGSDGRISEEKNYLQQDNIYILTGKSKPGFDAGGKLISSTFFLPDGSVVGHTTYKYNNEGNIILLEEYRNNGTAEEQLNFKYSFDYYDNKLNPYTNLNCEVPPYSINLNNILQTTVTNYIVTPGTPVTTVDKIIYKSYNSNGLPVKVSENGSDYIYEYK